MQLYCLETDWKKKREMEHTSLWWTVVSRWRLERKGIFENTVL